MQDTKEPNDRPMYRLREMRKPVKSKNRISKERT